MEPLAYRVEEAAALTKLGRTTLYREIAAGRLEAIKVGARTLIPRQALEDYIEHLRTPRQDGSRAV